MSSGPLNSDEYATWLAIKRLSGHALAAVGRDIEAAAGLSGADFGVLTRLEDFGGGILSQAALLMSLEWEKSRLSHQLTRMEKRQLVKRFRANNCSVKVHVLSEGKERVHLARSVHAGAVRKYILQHVSGDEARMLVKIVKRFENI